MSTPRKPESEKLKPGRKPKAPEDRQSASVPVRLTPGELAELDTVTKNRNAFARAAVLDAIKRAKRKAARAAS